MSIMNYKLNRPVKITEAGIIIQHWLFWLGTSPDEVIFDKKNQEIGLLEIKCPQNKSFIKYFMKVLLLKKHFILSLTKIKNHIERKNITLITTLKFKLQWD